MSALSVRTCVRDPNLSPPPSTSISGDADKDRTRNGLLALAEMFPVFPSPKGCDKHGAKVNFAQELDLIARREGTARPQSRPWDPNSQEPHRGWVLKREFSDAARHVYIPIHPLNDDAKTSKREKTRIRNFMKKIKAKDGFLWLQQEYVQTLSTVGEFRFFCVNGEPIRVVITSANGPGEPHPGETSSLEGIDTMLGLEEIRYVNPHVLGISCVFPQFA